MLYVLLSLIPWIVILNSVIQPLCNWTRMSLTSVNPLNPKSGQHLISPSCYIAELFIKIMRVKEIALIVKQILLVSLKRCANVSSPGLSKLACNRHQALNIGSFFLTSFSYSFGYSYIKAVN